MATTTVTPIDQTRYLTLREATRLGYGSDTTLRRRIKQGSLPAVKIGSRLRVLRRDLDALARPVQPTAHSCDDDLKWIQKLVEQAPPLTDEQRAELAVILGGDRAVTARRSASMPPLSPERTRRLSDPLGGA